MFIKGSLSATIIAPSISPWSSPIVVIIKANGMDIRLCIDYQVVNMVRLMVYPMLLINDLLEDLDKLLWYWSLEMASGFWVVSMTPRVRLISTFITPFGLFEWARMPFGLKNTPQIYQRIVDNALYGHMRIKSRHSIYAWDSMGNKVENLLDVCDRWNLSISVAKSYWGRRKVTYLRHQVSRDGLEAKPKDLEAFSNHPFPTKLKSMQSFLGSLNYYSRLIEDFAEHGRVYWPVTFTSGTLKANELNYGIADKEVLALLRMLDVCYSQLVTRSSKVLSRFSTLAWLLKSNGLDGRLGRWTALLSGWMLEITKCAKGEEEILGAIAADITPRAEVDEVLIAIASKKQPRKMIAMIPPTVESEENLLATNFDGSARRIKQAQDEEKWIADLNEYLKGDLNGLSKEAAKTYSKITATSPGNVQGTYPFQVISMDHIPSLPKSFKRNTELLIWADLFNGYVITKAGSSWGAQVVAENYEECVFRRFCASEVIRHDREPGFMAYFFPAFNWIVKMRQSSTMAFRPQGNGKAERTVQTLTRTLKLYVSDVNQQDWGDYAERLTYALNTAQDRVRGDTSFYLVHWPDKIEQGSQVWLYLDRVKEGFARKQIHIEYRIFPVVHLSKLKLVRAFPDRPTCTLLVEEGDRVDFDEALLAEDSWETPLGEDEFEVEWIADLDAARDMAAYTESSKCFGKAIANPRGRFRSRFNVVQSHEEASDNL
ncbi:reverse transcriptase, partial [Phytophthora megakarya]